MKKIKLLNNKKYVIVFPDNTKLKIINGDQFWYCDGVLHKEFGPAVIYKNGTREWYEHGVRHRNDGPAVICMVKGVREWWRNGKLHRLHGPARTRYDGNDAYYINGVWLNKDDFENQTKEIGNN